MKEPFVRKLKKVGVCKKILSLFYKSTVESLICFCIICWYGSSSKKDQQKVKKVIKTARKLGCDITTLKSLFESAMSKKSSKIIKDITHPLHSHFSFLKSGTHLNSMYARPGPLTHGKKCPQAHSHFQGERGIF